MPLPCRPTSRQRYTQDDVQKALDAIRNDGFSISAASRTYNVPKTTLHDKLTGKYKEVVPVGRPAVLSKDEEDLIVQWVLDLSKAGFPVNKDQLIDSVAKLVKDLDRPNPFQNNVPGEKWYNLFLNRHPEISKRVSQALTTSRANVSEEQLRAWFHEVKEYLEGKQLMGIFNDPRRVFNADESAFYLCPKGKKVLARKGEKAVYQRTGNDEKECVTVLINANAAGEIAPPMIVFDYERVPTAISNRFPGKWGLGKSESGWMTRETFYEYVTNVFHPWLRDEKIQFPVILFIDGHTSHLSKYLSDYCSANEIEVVALYPNSTHLLQPLDVAVFRPLKALWKKSVDQWRFNNAGRRMKKEEFAPELKKALDKLDKSVVVSGFKATGLDKLNPDKVHYNLILKSNGSNASCPSLVSLERKANDVRAHLSYLETKIGLDKIRIFAAGEVDVRDETLYEVWRQIKQELKTLKEDIEARRKKPQNQEPAFDNLAADDDNPDDPDETLTDVETDPNEILATPLAAEEQSLPRIIAEGNDASLDESEIQNFIQNLGFAQFHDGMAIELVMSDVHPVTPNPATVISVPVTQDLPSTSAAQDLPSTPATQNLPSTPATQNLPSTPATQNLPISSVQLPLTPDPGPSTSSAYDFPSPTLSTLEEIFQSISPTITVPSPFKRCLPYPSPTSIKKKLKSKEPTPAAITGECYKKYLENKERKKKEEEELKERRRMIREANKNIKKEKDALKKKSKKLFEVESESSDTESDDPTPIKPEDLDNLSVNTWVVVPYVVEGEKDFFVGQVKSINQNFVCVKFLEKKGSKFVWPVEDDVDNEVPLTEIIQILKAPLVERRGFFSFKEKIISK